MVGDVAQRSAPLDVAEGGGERVAARARGDQVGGRGFFQKRMMRPCRLWLRARGPYWCAAARRAYLVVPEIGVLKWFLKMRSNGSVNLKINGRF